MSHRPWEPLFTTGATPEEPLRAGLCRDAKLHGPGQSHLTAGQGHQGGADQAAVCPRVYIKRKADKAYGIGQDPAGSIHHTESGLVHACAGRFRGRGIEYDDLYGAGCMGLVKACDNFDPERGVCFSTYAVPVILGEIKKLFREGGTVKVSRSLKELGMRVQAAREHTMKLCGTEPTLSQLAEQLGESVENVAMAIQAAQPAMSLTPEGREDAEHQLDIPVESPEEALADRISLEEVLRALPEQDRQLIQLRFYGNRTQSETAKVLHTTQVQISRRERKILVLLRRRLLEE